MMGSISALGKEVLYKGHLHFDAVLTFMRRRITNHQLFIQQATRPRPYQLFNPTKRRLPKIAFHQQQVYRRNIHGLHRI